MANTPDEAGLTANNLMGVSQNENQENSESESESYSDAADVANAANDEDKRSVKIIVCSTCRKEDGSAEEPTPGQQLFAATCAANEGNKNGCTS